MHNYSDTMAHTHHDEDIVQVMREVFCHFMHHCCKAQLAQLAECTNTISRMRKYSKKQASFSEK